MVKVFGRFGAFLVSVREELKQVAWPTRAELTGSLLVVITGVMILAGYISMCDFILSRAAQSLLR